MNKFLKLLLASLVFISFGFSQNILKIEDTNKEYSVVVLGGGVSALTSGIYLARAGYKPLIIEGQMPGGLITQSDAVENWPSEGNITGDKLVHKIKTQAKKNGCLFVSGEVVSVDFSKRPFSITIKDALKNNLTTIKTQACVIAMGSSPNYLNIPGEKKYWGKGVSNCAICDGAFYKDKTVAIVGGGDAAILEASYLSKLAKKTYVLVRKDFLKAKDKEKVNLLKKMPNIEFIYNTEVLSIDGDDSGLSGINVLNNKTQKKYDLKIEGLFLAIGSTANSQIFKNQLKLDETGLIKVDQDQQTSLKGVYAVGDIADETKQAITAAATGAKAAIALQSYLQTSHVPNSLIVDVENKDENISVVHVNTIEQFKQEISQSNTYIIMDFYATWCGPCKRLSPILDEYSKILSGKVKIIKINVEKLPELSNQYNIRAMPTVIVLDKNKKILFQKVGLNNISDLLVSLENIKDSSLEDIEHYLDNVEN